MTSFSTLQSGGALLRAASICGASRSGPVARGQQEKDARTRWPLRGASQPQVLGSVSDFVTYFGSSIVPRRRAASFVWRGDYYALQ